VHWKVHLFKWPSPYPQSLIGYLISLISPNLQILENPVHYCLLLILLIIMKPVKHVFCFMMAFLKVSFRLIPPCVNYVMTLFEQFDLHWNLCLIVSLIKEADLHYCQPFISAFLFCSQFQCSHH